MATSPGIDQWLLQTASPDESAVHDASAALKGAFEADSRGFLSHLLTLASQGDLSPLSLPAALYAKNCVRKEWGRRGRLGAEDKEVVREGVLSCALHTQGRVLRVLCEALQLVVQEEHEDAGGQGAGPTNSWPQLVPRLADALARSDVAVRLGSAPPGPGPVVATASVVAAVAAAVRPFQYFSDAEEEVEPVPAPLEAMSQALLVPLLPLLRLLVEQVEARAASPSEDADATLLLLLKAYYRAVRSHMPSALVSHLPFLLEALVRLLRQAVLQRPLALQAHETLIKCWKRAGQVCAALVTRHLDHLDPSHLGALAEVVLGLCQAGAPVEGLAPLQRRVLSVSFDLLSELLDSSQGWIILSPHFEAMIQTAVFPALCLKSEELELWEEDEDEFLRLLLPNDLDESDDVEGEFYVPRRSASHLLGLIATSKGPDKVASGGGRKVRKAAKGPSPKRRQRPMGTAQTSAGALLVLPYLEHFVAAALAPACSQDDVSKCFGALVAYASCSEYLSRLEASRLAALLSERVFPFLPTAHGGAPASAPLAAVAAWLLGELSQCLPDSLVAPTFQSLGGALGVPDQSHADPSLSHPVSCHLVRAAAGRALAKLIQDEVTPPDLLTLLQQTVQATRGAGEDDCAVAFELLEITAQMGGTPALRHLPAILEALLQYVHGMLAAAHGGGGSGRRKLWLALSAVAALAGAWEDGAEEEAEEGSKEEEQRQRTGQHLASAMGRMLQHLWKVGSQGEAGMREAHPPGRGKEEEEDEEEEEEDSSLVASFDSSIILEFVLKHFQGPEEARPRRGQPPPPPRLGPNAVEQLLRVWAPECADWSAWEEGQDQAVSDVINQAARLQEKGLLPSFLVRPVPPAPAPPVAPQSLAEAMTAFLAAAIEDAGTDSVRRCCRSAHALLLACQKRLADSHAQAPASAAAAASSALDGLVARLCQVSVKRLQALQSSSGAAGAAEKEDEEEEEEEEEAEEEEEGAAGAIKPLCLLLCSCVLVSRGAIGYMGAPTEGLLLWLRTLAQAVGVPAAALDPQGRAEAAELQPSSSEAFLQSELKLTVLAMATTLRGLAGGGLPEDALGRATGLALATSVQAQVALRELQEEGRGEGEEGEEGGGEEEDEEEGESEREDSDMEEEDGGEASASGEEDEEAEQEELDLGIFDAEDAESVLKAILQEHGHLIPRLQPSLRSYLRLTLPS